jgi:hypothetical protein
LPQVVVVGLKLQRAARMLRTATHGRRPFTIHMHCPPVSSDLSLQRA